MFFGLLIRKEEYKGFVSTYPAYFQGINERPAVSIPIHRFSCENRPTWSVTGFFSTDPFALFPGSIPESIVGQLPGRLDDFRYLFVLFGNQI